MKAGDLGDLGTHKKLPLLKSDHQSGGKVFLAEVIKISFKFF